MGLAGTASIMINPHTTRCPERDFAWRTGVIGNSAIRCVRFRTLGISRAGSGHFFGRGIECERGLSRGAIMGQDDRDIPGERLADVAADDYGAVLRAYE